MIKNNKILTFLLCLLFAFGFWVYVITTVSPGSEATYHNIPVILQGSSLLKERGLVNVTDKAPTISLTLYGNRTDLNKINSSNITVVADLSHIYEPGTHRLTYSITYPGDVASDAISERLKEPSTVVLEVERNVAKPVPVQIQYKGSVGADYIVLKEERELDREEVLISGPESVISKITQARIEVDLEGRTSSFSENYRYILCDAEGNPVDADKVETNVPSVNLTLTIHRIKTVELKVTVINGGGATEETSEIKINPETIKVSGSDTALEGLDTLILGTINLGELTSDSTKRFDILLPSGVTDLGNTERAVVTIKFPELSTKTLKITNIIAQNVPDGMKAEVLTQSVEVTVRGPKALISRLTSRDVSVTVDLKNAQEGSFTVRAVVVLGEEFSRVGPIGAVNVAVTVMPEEAREK